MKISKWLSVSLAILLTACAVDGSSISKNTGTPEQLKTTVGRVITVSGNEISEGDLGKFITWKCKDFISGGKTLVEVGIFSDPEFSEAGFILYDGENIGELTDYRRQGLNRRWDWDEKYSFLIEPDGTGAYFDFSSVPDGESTSAKGIYKCKK